VAEHARLVELARQVVERRRAHVRRRRPQLVPVEHLAELRRRHAEVPHRAEQLDLGVPGRGDVGERAREVLLGGVAQRVELEPHAPHAARGRADARAGSAAGAAASAPSARTNVRRCITCPPVCVRCVRAPRAAGDGRHEVAEPAGGKSSVRPLLGAHVDGHEQPHHVGPVVPGEPRRLAAEEGAREVPVLRLVAVDRGFVRHHRHQPGLGVLLLHQVLARGAAHLAAEEQVEAGVEAVPRHRVLGAQQLGRQPEPRAHEAPRRAHLAEHRQPLGRLELDGRAGVVLGRPPAEVDPHRLLQPLGVRGARPLEARDVAAHPRRPHHRLAGGAQQVAHEQRRVAHHVVEHPAALLVAAPEPRRVRPGVLLGGAREVGPAGEPRAALPQQLPPVLDVRAEELVLEVAVRESGAPHQREQVLGLGHGARERLLARHAPQRAAPALDRVDERLDVLDARVVGPADPDRVDGGSATISAIDAKARASPTSSARASAAASPARSGDGLHTPTTSASRTPTNERMWKRVMNPSRRRRRRGGR
jgi:hypothetical protein